MFYCKNLNQIIYSLKIIEQNNEEIIVFFLLKSSRDANFMLCQSTQIIILI